jgi:tetratricopeptide (TPR) repeat protein
MRARALILSAALWFVSAPAKSQVNDGNGSTFKGQIEAGLTRGLTVQLYDVSRHATFTTEDIRPDGAFEIRGAPGGSYLVTVVNERGEDVYQGTANVGGGVAPPLMIRLREDDAARAISGTVSVRELQHPPSRKAYDAMVQAQKFSEAGDFAKAAGSLEKVISLSPDFADGHTNLAAQYLRLGRYEESIRETERAIALGGSNAPRLCNLAFAQLHAGRNGDAMESARAALRAAPENPQAHYLMGVVLWLNHGPIAAATAQLEIAGRSLPAAREVLARIAAGAVQPR